MAEGIPEIPNDLPVHHRRFWTAMRNVLIALQEGRSVVAGVSNVKLTPVGAGIVIQFSRPLDADNVTLYASPNSDFSGAVPIQLGTATVYRMELGTNIAQWFWLKTKRGNLSGTLVGPFTATSLAAGTAAVIPKGPAALNQSIVDATTERFVKGSGGRFID